MTKRKKRPTLPGRGRQIRNPTGSGVTVSRMVELAADGPLYHGGVVRLHRGPYVNLEHATAEEIAENEKAVKAAGDAFDAALERGLAALEAGESEFVADVERIPNSPVEIFDIFDVETGEHLMVWRVGCRERRTH